MAVSSYTELFLKITSIENGLAEASDVQESLQAR